jgi:hypothetical protein
MRYNADDASPPTSPLPTSSRPYSRRDTSQQQASAFSDKQLLKKAKLFLDERQRTKNRILSLISFTGT